MAALRAENVRLAVNQTLAGASDGRLRIDVDDEVAFLPPVTGGCTRWASCWPGR